MRTAPVPRPAGFSAMAKPRRTSWPDDPFLKTGPKLTAQALREYPVPLIEPVEDFLRWRNGGVPVRDSFKMVYDDRRVVARVTDFYGVNPSAEGDITDLNRVILHEWHDLPRGTLPLGEVQIEGEEFEGSQLLTFLWGERAGKVVFFDTPHDCRPLDPQDEDRLVPLTNTLLQFIKGLKDHETLRYRQFFRLTGDGRTEDLEAALVAAGTEEWRTYDSEFNDGPPSRYAGWWERDSKVYHFVGGAELHHVPLPDGTPPDTRCLAVDLNRWDRAEIVKRLKAALDGAGGWGLGKPVGRTAVDGETHRRAEERDIGR